MLVKTIRCIGFWIAKTRVLNGVEYDHATGELAASLHEMQAAARRIEERAFRAAFE